MHDLRSTVDGSPIATDGPTLLRNAADGPPPGIKKGGLAADDAFGSGPHLALLVSGLLILLGGVVATLTIRHSARHTLEICRLRASKAAGLRASVRDGP
jgi:hypothetical protein